MNEISAMKELEKLIDEEFNQSLNTNRSRIEILYKYMMVINTQRIADHLSAIEDVFGTIDIEEQ